MIRFRHALTLARTKLRSKRLLLAISIVISSLLFAALIAGIIIFTAAEKSAVSFVTKANGGVYRVEVNPVIPNSLYTYNYPISIQDIRHIREVEKQYYNDLAAKYKVLGIAYDKTTEVSALEPSPFFSPSTSEEQRFSVRFNSPVASYDRELKMNAYVKIAKNKLSDLKTVGARYGATGYYLRQSLDGTNLPNLMLVTNGHEDFTDTEMKAGDSTPYAYTINAIHNGSYTTQYSALLQRYLLPDQLEKVRTGIPVIVSAQEVAALFGKQKGIGSEPKDPAGKVTWLKSIQDKFAGYTYQACYRNAAEISKIQKIQRDYADIVNNKDNKDFIPASLQYNMPLGACGAVTVKSDTRTKGEKAIDAKQIADQTKLGTYVAPSQRLLTFEIVGIMSPRSYSVYSANVENYVQNLLTTDNMNSSAFIPQEPYDALPAAMKIATDPSPNTNPFSSLEAAGLTSSVLDFQTIVQARDFMNNETCPLYNTDCKRLFTAGPYGSNYLILDEIGKLFNTFLMYALPIVLGLATVIIWFTMVRVMSESRKETAVYRAMGAKRRDVVLIYLTYGLIIAGRIALVSLLLGIGTAWVVDYIYGQQLSAIAAASFGIISNSTRFSLFDITSQYLIMVIGVIFVVSMLAIIQPVIRSVRRSPIEDMRIE